MEYKITLKNTLAHFKKICVHKFWVAHYCFKAGLYWQGITHDFSKFSWVEFWESVKYYQGDSSPIPIAKKNQGYSLAWQHHKGRNPHHYEYWTDKYDEGTVAIKMPYKYAVELICDYLGAARAYLGKNFSYESEYKWWFNKCLFNSNMKMYWGTHNLIYKVFLEMYIKEKANQTPEDILKPKNLKQLYNEYSG